MADTVRFRLTADDMVHAARLFALASLRRRKTLVGLALVFVCVLVLMTAITGALVPPNPERLARFWPVILLSSIFPFVLVLLLGLVVNPIMARRIYRQQKSLQGEIALTWTVDKLEFDSEYGQFAMPWSHFTRWAEDKHSFVLFESDRLYRIIPKRVLDPASEQSLRDRFASIGA